MMTRTTQVTRSAGGDANSASHRNHFTLLGGTVIGSTFLEIDHGRQVVAPYPFG